jgi:DNA-binding transcriptional MocR family regulator
MNPQLPAAIAEVVVDLPETRSVSSDGVVSWSRVGREFAALEASGIEIRLDRAVAAAAARTPDTAPSSRGTDWIRFNPHELDGHALDRLRAWLELAYRRAAEP